MKILQLALGIIFASVSGIALAQSTVVDVDSSQLDRPSVSDFNTKGCGYSRPLRVAGMIGNPPFGWVERHDEHAAKDLESFGLGRSILDKLQKKLGISYISTGFLSYDRAIRALKRGEIDLLLAAYYRPQDLGKGTEILTPGYFRNIFTAYFKKGKEIPFTSLTDLEGWRGVIRREENIYPLIHQKLPKGISLTQVSTAKKAFEMLMNDEADYLISSPYAAEAELRRYKLNDDIIPATQAIFDSNLFFVFSKNSNCKELKQKFSEALQSDDFSKAEVDELIRALIDKWGERFREEKGLIEEEEEGEDKEIKKEESDQSPQEEISPSTSSKN